MSATDIGRLLAYQRTRQGRSARQVSLAAGLSESVVGKIEAGTMEPSLRVFAAIVGELQLSDREVALLVKIAATCNKRTVLHEP